MATPVEQRSRPWWRVGLPIVLVALWVPLAFFTGSFVGWSSETLGWLWGAVAFALGLVGAAMLVGGERRRVWLAVATGVSLALGMAVWYAAPPTHARLQARADQITWPGDWQQVSRDERGTTWCFKGCPQVEYTFRVPGGYDSQDQARVTAAFEAEGWSVRPSTDDVVLADGRWRAEITGTQNSPYGDVSVSFSG